MLAHLLRHDGRHVGMACSDGFFVDRRAIAQGDGADAACARKVLLNPSVEAAVLEAGGPGILKEGLGFDRCDVAVVTNVGEGDHLGFNDIRTPDDAFTVKRCPVDVVLPTGTAVLYAGDPLVARMAGLSAGSVTFFSEDPEDPVLAAHVASGGKGVTVRDGRIVLLDGEVVQEVVPVATLPCEGRVPYLVRDGLGAVAAAWAMGLGADRIRAGLQSFEAVQEIPGRFTAMACGDATVVVDSCRNPSAIAALVEALQSLPAGRRSIVYAGGAGRRDEDHVRAGFLLGSAFDRVVLFDAHGRKEPSRESFRTPLRRGIASAGRGAEIQEFAGREEAVDAVLDSLEPGEIVVIQADEFLPASSVEGVRSGIGRRERREA